MPSIPRRVAIALAAALGVVAVALFHHQEPANTATTSLMFPLDWSKWKWDKGHSILTGLHGCEDGIACKEVSANGYTFNCRFAGEQHKGDDRKHSVLLLHGFPEWSSMYIPLMKKLANQGHYAVACDQRGYSPKASPGDINDYAYVNIARDAYAVAKAAELSKSFHLVAHDHGAVLGWLMTGRDTAKGFAGASDMSIKSYTSLSVPHIDVFSKALEGPDADPEQVKASQYFPQFVEPDSASKAGSFYYKALWRMTSQKPFGVEETGFKDAAAFQKAMWWYHGAIPDYLAMPPVLPFYKMPKPVMAANLGFQLKPTPGIPAKQSAGKVDVPTLFGCGSKDDKIWCSRPYAQNTKDYVDSWYEYVTNNCGHDLLTVSKECPAQEVNHMEQAILDHIAQADGFKAPNADSWWKGHPLKELIDWVKNHWNGKLPENIVGPMA